MNIKKMGLFATPESQDALLFNMEQYHGGERVAFSMGMGLTWNFLSDQMPEHAEITLVMGTHAVELHEHGEKDKEVLREDAVVDTYKFSSREDLETALQMLDDYDGHNMFMEYQP